MFASLSLSDSFKCFHTADVFAALVRASIWLRNVIVRYKLFGLFAYSAEQWNFFSSYFRPNNFSCRTFGASLKSRLCYLLCQIQKSIFISFFKCLIKTWNAMEETHLSVFHSVSNRAHGRPRKSISSVRFQLVFFVRARDCMTFTLHDLADFYVESVTAHCIKINDHSCFHNRWPNWKTKLKLKHLWEQGCFGGPKQLAYSAYRKDRLWSQCAYYPPYLP